LIQTASGALDYNPSQHRFELELPQDRNGGRNSGTATVYRWGFTTNVEAAWTHLSFVAFSDNTAKFYVNGQEVAIGPQVVDGGQNGNFDYFNLGAVEGTDYWGDNHARTPSLRGQLDDVRIYNRALSTSEVQALCSTEMLPSFCDNFENGVIDSSLWEVGGDRFGYSGYGVGSWQWSQEETSGALRVRVWGPEDANAYQGLGWLRTKFNYNNGQSHLINFTWGASVNANHVDAYAIEICNGMTSQGPNSGWFVSDAPTNQNLYVVYSTVAGGPGQTNLPPTSWSIKIDGATQTATLFGGPNLTGLVLGQKTLDTASPWYLRFLQMDGSSQGYPAGDNSLYLYDFCSSAHLNAPSIVTQPQSQSVTAGGTIQFSVTASGTDPLSYQWRFNGGDLSNGGRHFQRAIGRRG
jgi:hypothetical protein